MSPSESSAGLIEHSGDSTPSYNLDQYQHVVAWWFVTNCICGFLLTYIVHAPHQNTESINFDMTKKRRQNFERNSDTLAYIFFILPVNLISLIFYNLHYLFILLYYLLSDFKITCSFLLLPRFICLNIVFYSFINLF